MRAEEKISLYRKFLNILSWRKFFLLLAFTTLTGITIGLFENRNAMYEFISHSNFSRSPPHDYALSEGSIAEIEHMLRQADLIVGIQVSIIDFNKNTRKTIYVGIDDDNLKLIYQQYIQSSITDLPLFNSDVENNVRISRLINGEFVCVSFKDTSAYSVLPNVAPLVDTICSNAIPPYYGKFTGILSIYLKRQPTTLELDQLRTLSKSMSLSIFERDFR